MYFGAFSLNELKLGGVTVRVCDESSRAASIPSTVAPLFTTAVEVSTNQQCNKEGGFCLSDGNRCNGEIKILQNSLKDQCTCCVSQKEECGSYESISHLISVSDRIRDNASPLNNFGGIAALYKSKTSVVSSTHICGASLISQEYLLTAAHCVVGKERSLSISLGRADLNEQSAGDEYEIKEVYIHPEYKSGRHKYNDIALLKTRNKVQYSTTVWPFCLPNVNQIFDDFSVVRIAGWGLVNQTNKASVLKSSYVDLVENRRCEGIWRQHASYHYDRSLEYSYPQGYTDLILCGGRQGVDACEGDSGGPMTFRNEYGLQIVIGVTSRGIANCPIEPIVPGFYTNVGKFIDWINNATGISQSLASQPSPSYPIADCPEEFHLSKTSNQCFKFDNSSTPRSWNDSKMLCEGEGLKMAMPSDAAVYGLGEYLLNTYGDVSVWVNARANGTHFIWERDASVLEDNSGLWFPGEPGSWGFNKGYCLYLRIWKTGWNSAPGKIYSSHPCSAQNVYPLCERTSSELANIRSF